jgi:membrane fusion protein (multidrug efflux system)
MPEAAEKATVTTLRAASQPATTRDDARPPAVARDGGVEAPARPRPAQPEKAKAAPKKGGRRRLVRWALLVGGPVLLLVGIGWFWLTGGRYVSTDNAYVQADTVNVATDVAGLVEKVEVQDNERVKAGQELFRLDDSTYRTALDRAEAELGTTRASLEALKASYAQMQAGLAKAEADVSFYQKEFQRVQDLVSRNVTAQSQLDAATHNLETARDQVTVMRQQLAGIAAQLDGRPDAPIEDHSQYKAALAARDKAARDLAHTVVKAPMDGIVANVSSLQPGEYLAAGQAAFALVAVDHVWVEANPKETDLTYVQPGQPVTVTVDTYPGHVWEGTVASLSPASQASFSLLPAQNTSGNWVKVVQRIPLRVRVDTKPDEPQLRAGMSAETEIDTGHQRHLSDLLSWL